MKSICFRQQKEYFLGAGHGNIWDDTDGCAQHYICATAINLLLILSQSFNIIINLRISAPGYARDVVDGLNATDKGSFYT